MLNSVKLLSLNNSMFCESKNNIDSISFSSVPYCPAWGNSACNSLPLELFVDVLLLRVSINSCLLTILAETMLVQDQASFLHSSGGKQQQC